MQRRSTNIQYPLPNNQADRLYIPLRRSLLRQNLSSSRLSRDQNPLSGSRQNIQGNNQISMSRLSRRIKSLSPQQVSQIKSNIYIPVNKRLIPTNNLHLIKNKQFTAIDIQQKVYQPIQQVKFDLIMQQNAKKPINFVKEIVYQFDGNGYSNKNINYQNKSNFQSNQTNYHQSNQINYRQSNQINHPQTQPNYNQYNRIQNETNNQPDQIFDIYNATQTMGSAWFQQSNNTPITNTRNSLQNRNSLAQRLEFQDNSSNVQQATSRFIRVDNHRVQPKKSIYTMREPPKTSKKVSSFVHDYQRNMSFNRNTVSPTPITFNKNLRNVSPLPVTYKLNESKLSSIQLPQISSKSGIIKSPYVGPIQSMTAQTPRLLSPNSFIPPSIIPTNTFSSSVIQSPKQYKFNKSQTTESTIQNKRNGQQFRYNVFSIIDQPLNTNCEGKACCNNEILATRPKDQFEWSQQ